MFQYPYGDSQQLNLDWLMEQWQETKASIDGSLQGEIDRVEAAITDLLTARDQAVAAQTAAEIAATSASGYAGTASTAASTATAQAAAAAASAALAGSHASNAQTSETNAGLQATAAGNSASAAATSATNARNSELAAAASSSAAAGNALYAEGYAKGTQNGNPVSSGSPYYENNAKYYSDQAAQDASDAADSAQDAQDAAALIDMPATADDIGKAIVVKTVADGKVSEYEFGEAGGGGTPGIIRSIENVPIASFDDGLALPVNKLVVDITPVQSGSGDPTPDNVRPITGWTGAEITGTGKNLLPTNIELLQLINTQGTWNDNVYTLNELTFTINIDGSITVNGLSTAITYFNFITQASPEYISQGSYVLHKTETADILISVDKNNAFWGSASVNDNILTNPSYAYITAYLYIAANTNITNATIKPMFEKNTVSSPFEPSKIKKYPVTFPLEVGTVWGGILTNQGTNEWKLRVIYGCITKNTSDMDNYTDYPGWRNSGIAQLIGDNINGRVYGAFTNISKASDYINSGGISANTRGSSDLVILSKEWFNKTQEEWIALALDVQIVVPILTPVEYTITTTEVIQLLSGYNNVWADTGNINLLQYYADSKKYIDDQDTLIKALIATELPNMTADTALVANDFRIVNNTLYKITSNVASGGTLTPGTNCTATTITDVLKSLL